MHHVVERIANLLSLIDVSFAVHGGEHRCQARALAIPPPVSPYAHLVRSLMQIGDDGGALDQGAHQHNSREQVTLPNKLPNAKGEVNTLGNDLASRVTCSRLLC